MRWHQAIGLVVLAVCAQTCEGCEKDEEDWLEAVAEQEAEDAARANRPDGGPQQPADEPSSDTSGSAEDSAFVPMADDLIVRLEYGDAMDGPGWYRVEMVDVDNPMISVCDTTMETSSEEGLSAFGSDDYTCQANVFFVDLHGRPWTYWRKAWDSNPRRPEGPQQFSRLSHSSALAAFRRSRLAANAQAGYEQMVPSSGATSVSRYS